MGTFPAEIDEGAPPGIILILDDSPFDREVFRRFLSSDLQREYVIHEQVKIEDALRACRDLRPDCVLVDYSLGDGTGLDFLYGLSEIGGTRAFPVVMLTGSGSEEIASAAFKAGAQDYLVKGTLTPDALQRSIRGAIYKAKAERLLEAQRLELERLFREAQEANARKDQFLAALSHELRTPLTPILTAVSSINPRNLSAEEMDDIFETIRRNVELEARLIDDLLDLTRIAKGKLGLELRPVDAHQVVRHALATCEGEIAAKKLALRVDLDAEHHTVKADPARLQQVFWNLVKNAVKFTPVKGSLRITSRENACGQLELEVCDSGCGISAEMLPKIFDAFEQGGAQMTRRFGGLGLGLAISRALIDAHEGTIRAESDGADRGSRFVVTLPLRRDLPDEAGSHPGPAAGADGADGVDGGIASGSRRILLVEDHVDSARFLSRILERRGYRVRMVGSVADALSAFQSEEFDFIVSDIGLPDGDGLGLMESLRKKQPALRGIALSGYGMEHDHARSRAAGFGEHLTKPIDWPQLEAALRRLTARSGDGAA